MSVRFRFVKTFDMSVQQPVPDRVPEVEDAVPVGVSEEARAVDDVGLPGEDRAEEEPVLLRSYSRSASWMTRCLPSRRGGPSRPPPPSRCSAAA